MDGRAANTLTGNFTISDVAFDTSGATVLRFHTSFEQHSGGIPPGLFRQFDFDASPIPEPSTWILLSSGFLGLAFSRLRSHILRSFLAAIMVVLLSTNALAKPIAHLELHSEPGDFVGGGVDSDVTYTPVGAILFGLFVERTLASGSPTLLDFTFIPAITNGNDNYTTIHIGTDQLGIPIQPGTYFDAQRDGLATPGHPVLDVSFDHRGCFTDTGNFTITNVSFLLDNIVNSFSVSFEQYCDGATSALFGTLDYSASGILPNQTPELATLLFLSSGLAGLVIWRRYAHP